MVKWCESWLERQGENVTKSKYWAKAIDITAMLTDCKENKTCHGIFSSTSQLMVATSTGQYEDYSTRTRRNKDSVECLLRKVIENLTLVLTSLHLIYIHDLRIPPAKLKVLKISQIFLQLMMTLYFYFM